MTIKAIFFDIDGTLVDSNEQHILVWQQVFGGIGRTFSRESIHEQVGKGGDNLVPALLPDADAALIERLSEEHGAIYRARFLRAVKPFPGAAELLQRVAAGGQQVVLASSASREEVEHYLDLLDARAVVAATTSGDDVEHTKPAPDIFAAALRKVAPLTADEVVVVGDSPYDVGAAARCGIRTIALRSGRFGDERLRHAGAAALLDDAAALLAEYERTTDLNELLSFEAA